MQAGRQFIKTVLRVEGQTQPKGRALGIAISKGRGPGARLSDARVGGAHLPVGGSARRGGFPAAQSGGRKAADPSNNDAERLPTTG